MALYNNKSRVLSVCVHMLDLFCDDYIYRAGIHQPDKMLYVFQLLSLKGKPIDFQCGG